MKRDIGFSNQDMKVMTNPIWYVLIVALKYRGGIWETFVRNVEQDWKEGQDDVTNKR